MRIYEIADEEFNHSVGCLLYFEKEKSFIIELKDCLDEWNAPLLMASHVKRGEYTIGREISLMWVKERIIPSGRQNISSILANAKMPIYDEMTLLEKSSGRCSQDKMYIKKMDYIPEYIRNRMDHNLVECVMRDDYSLLCFFEDQSVKKINLTALDNSEVRKIMANDTVYLSGHIAAGGYLITFNDSIDIEAKVLYENGIDIPLSLSDFYAFVSQNTIDTSECCNVLGCTRQNLSNYIEKGVLTPIKRGVKGNLYTKGNIYRRNSHLYNSL